MIKCLRNWFKTNEEKNLELIKQRDYGQLIENAYSAGYEAKLFNIDSSFKMNVNNERGENLAVIEFSESSYDKICNANKSALKECRPLDIKVDYEFDTNGDITKFFINY